MAYRLYFQNFKRHLKVVENCRGKIHFNDLEVTSDAIGQMKVKMVVIPAIVRRKKYLQRTNIYILFVAISQENERGARNSPTVRRGLSGLSGPLLAGGRPLAGFGCQNADILDNMEGQKHSFVPAPKIMEGSLVPAPPPPHPGYAATALTC